MAQVPATQEVACYAKSGDVIFATNTQAAIFGGLFILFFATTIILAVVLAATIKGYNSVDKS